MKEYLLHMLLFLKKQRTNTIFIVFLILLPVSMFLAEIYMTKNEKSSSIPVGYYFDFDDDEVENDLIKNLNEVSGRLNLIHYKNLDEMLNDTSAAKLECSYVLTEGLTANVASDDYKDIIIVYNSPQTIISDMVNELIFAAVYRAAGDEVLYFYANNNMTLVNEAVDIEDLTAILMTEYNNQLTYGHTFSLDFGIYDEESAELDDSVTRTGSFGTTLPYHGIIAVFLFLCLLLSCTEYSLEVEKGTLLKLQKIERIKISSCIIHSWLIPSVISSLISIVLLQGVSNLGKEISVMLFYYLMLMIFGLLLNLIIKKSIIITALIPLLIIGSLIFTPILVDISKFLQVATIIEKLFLPYYYLMFF